MKKILIILICLFIPFLSVNALEIPEVYSSKVLIYNVTDGVLLHEKDIDVSTSIASLTKIMTVYTAVMEGNLDEEVLITNQMLWGIPWELRVTGLKAGETYTLREICYAAMIDSGADATNIIAYVVKGSLEEFVKSMNSNAEKLGMSNTHYVNVHGLDAEGHYSTANDISKLILAGLDNKDFQDIYYKQAYKLKDDLTVKRYYNDKINNSGLSSKNLLGGKTGWTDDAGVCFAGVYFSDDHEFLIIVLNAPYEEGENRNIDDMITLMKFIDDEYNYYTVFKKGTSVGSIPIFLGKEGLYKVSVGEDVNVFLPSDFDRSKAYYDTTYISSIMYDAKKGKHLGSVRYFYDGKEIGYEKVSLEEDIEADISQIIDYYTNDVILVISLIVLVLVVFLVRYLKPISNKKKK